MAWLRIDDGLFLHPKWVQTPAAARALWVTALSYCGKFANGGLIHPSLLPVLGGCVDDAEALVTSGLWERSGEAYQIHDFAQYNESSTPRQREHISEVRAEAGRAGGYASGESRRSKRGQNEANTKQIEANRTPEPVPEGYISTPPVHNYSTAHSDPATGGGGESPKGEEEPRHWDWDEIRKRLRGPARANVAFIARTLAEADRDPTRRHWRRALDQAICDAHPDSVEGYAAHCLRRWAAGDTPPAPPPRPRLPDRADPRRQEFLQTYHAPVWAEAVQ